MDPTNYQIAVQNPLQSTLQGYQAGAAIRNDQVQQQQQAVALQVQQQQRQVINSLLTNPNATGEDYSKAMLVVPQMAEQIKQSWATKDKAQQSSQLSDLTQIGSAIQSGQPQLAADILNQRADAMDKGGQPTQQSQILRAQAQSIMTSPDHGLATVKFLLAGHPDGKAVIDSLAAANKDARDQQLQPAAVATANAGAVKAGADATVAQGTIPAQIAKPVIDNQVKLGDAGLAIKRFGLDADKFQSDVQLAREKNQLEYGKMPEYVAKAVDGATTESIAASQSASRMTDLAARIDKSNLDDFTSRGAVGTAGEAWKKAFGSQNELTRLRSEYNRIVTPAAMAAYKTVASGSTSDKDIDTAMTGVPKDNASVEQMSSFLRGAAKLQVYQSVLKNAESEWLGRVNNLGRAASDVEIDGVKVPAGTTFKQFTDQYLGKKVQSVIDAQTVATRPYMQFATAPAPTAPSAPATPVLGD